MGSGDLLDNICQQGRTVGLTKERVRDYCPTHTGRRYKINIGELGESPQCHQHSSRTDLLEWQVINHAKRGETLLVRVVCHSRCWLSNLSVGHGNDIHFPASQSLLRQGSPLYLGSEDQLAALLSK